MLKEKYFQAPESYRGVASDTRDSWCIGVILYYLLHSELPFASKNDYLNSKVKPVTRKHISLDFQSLIEKCLNPAHEQRPTLEQIQQLPFIKSLQPGCLPDNVRGEDSDLQPPLSAFHQMKLASHLSEEQKPAYPKLKLLVVGPSEAGKSPILENLMSENRQELKHRPTTNPMANAGHLVIKSKAQRMELALEVWDTSGAAWQRDLLPMYFRQTCCFVVVFDCTSEESFAEAKGMVRMAREYPLGERPTVFLVANKIDLADERRVFEKEMAQVEGIDGWFEVSCVVGYDISLELFWEQVVDTLASRVSSQEITPLELVSRMTRYPKMKFKKYDEAPNQKEFRKRDWIDCTWQQPLVPVRHQTLAKDLAMNKEIAECSIGPYSVKLDYHPPLFDHQLIRENRIAGTVAGGEGLTLI